MKPFGNMIDPRVRLIGSEDAVYRDIDPKWHSFYLNLWNDGVIRDLCARGLLLETRLKQSEKGEGGIVRFEQSRLPFVSYPHEWAASMLRAAAEQCLALHEALLDRGLCLVDSHPWNFVFHGGRPLWVDLTSLDRFSPSVAAGGLRQFKVFFLNALDVISRGEEEIARSLMAHSFSSVSDACYRMILAGGNWQRQSWPRRIPALFMRAHLHSFRMMFAEWRRFWQFRPSEFSTPSRAKKVVARLRAELNGLSASINTHEWTSYIQAGQDALTPVEMETRILAATRYENAKVRAMDKWLGDLRGEARTVLDLGCNKGLFAQIAWMHGFTVAGVDADPGAIDSMFHSVVHSKASISCGIADFVSPREGLGMLTNPLPTFVERFRSDIVVCVAVTHHLYFGRYRMRLHLIARLLSMYARKYLIVEFVPKEDPFLKNHYPESSSEAGYSIESFSQAMAEGFVEMEVLPSFPSGRSLLLLRKRQLA